MPSFIGKLTKNISIKGILKFIGEAAAKSSLSWATEKILNNVFTNEEETILEKLQDVHDKFEEIKTELKKMTVEIGLAHQFTRIFQAEIDINHKYELLISIMSIKDSWERNTEAERLRAGILDTNTGILSHMSAVHHVLVGGTITDPTEKGLLEMMSTKLIENIGKDGFTKDQCEKHIMDYFEKTVFLQFKASILFIEASKNPRFCCAQLYLMVKRLNEQINVLYNFTKEKNLNLPLQNAMVNIIETES